MDDKEQQRLGEESITPSPQPRRVLVLGATGYVGGRLVPRLLQAGHDVSVAVRSPEKVRATPWGAEVTVHQVDLDEDPRQHPALAEALEDQDVIYYLVHSMGGGSDFEEQEAQTAERLAAAAHEAGVQRIVYLGGLHPEGAELSPHMRSRAAVARILLDSPVDTIAFQAGIIIGSGSASFEMIRHLARTLRLMPAPDWVANRVEPLGIRDVLYYLLAAADVPGSINATLDVGNRQTLTYAQVMKTFAKVAGLAPRHVIALPIPAPTLSGMWVGLVTPLPMSLTIPLVQSLQLDAVTGDRRVDELIPPPASGFLTFEEAVTLALRREREGAVDTTWDADVGPLDQAAASLPNDPQWAGHPVYEDARSVTTTEASAEAVWRVIEGIGGTNGWYSWPLAWRVRGVWDKLVGGAGLNRGRRLPDVLRVGDPVDWWRVVDLEPGRSLTLRAEMKVAGEAWLEFTVRESQQGTELAQRAVFYPTNVRGTLYWYSMAPFHRFIFPTMLERIVATAAATSHHDARPPAGEERS
ncbi:SDR family oxidoreductase [Citricoccus sp. NR2]|uniref:SDR family oxidoreductase n=1 Tax=Citricoccus sp. NR2 TaxID=3004095 RepID=UPI0022DE04C2|nr:SDR family oxidoreductase [Citricoccus sp. NR2]WBL19803.1 SDR family oxidoreductase [Citricoccus sp. NR2]